MAYRCEDEFEFPIGCTVVDNNGDLFCFVGWNVNTAGKAPVFVLVYNGVNRSPLISYSAAFSETLLKKFPDAGLFLKEEKK